MHESSDVMKDIAELIKEYGYIMPEITAKNVMLYSAYKQKTLRAPLKTPSEKKQLCTASAASIPLVVRKHAFDGFSCIYCTYLLFLTQNGFLEMPLNVIRKAAE